jgi:hypothetical protein
LLRPSSITATLMSPKIGFLLLAIGASIICGIVGCHAARNEISGTAIYQKSAGWRGMGKTSPEFVTRAASSDEFRRATNLQWGVSAFCLIVAVVGFKFYRKLED